MINIVSFLENKQNGQQHAKAQQLGPINMVDQERIKLERKRYRNRIAASKCRQRKLERISKLQERVSKLANKNEDLRKFILSIEEIVARLNSHIGTHRKLGCDIREVRC